MSLFKKILSRLRFYRALFLLRAAAVLGRPALAARVMAGVAWRAVPAGRGNRPVVLCLGRTVFVDDVKAMAKYSGQIEYVVVHLQYFEQVFNHFFSRRQLRNMTEYNYHVNHDTDGGKKRYAEFLRRLLPELQRAFGFSAMLSGNFGYLVQQELQRVCEENAMPFFVLHREGMIGFGGPDYRAGSREQYQNIPFVGAKMMFYNEAARDLLLSAAIPGYTGDKMAVVGVPRFDGYVAEKSRSLPSQIVFFSFYPWDRFHYLQSNPVKFKEIVQRSFDFHRAVMEFAARHPEVKVIIKTKNAPHYFQYVRGIRAASFSAIANLVVTNAANLMDLILNSTAVIGFNSTTLIEALLAGKLVITPDFSDLLPPDSSDFFHGFPELLKIARTADDLERSIFDRSEGGKNLSRREAFLRKYMYIPDGQAGSRAEDIMIKSINEYEPKH